MPTPIDLHHIQERIAHIRARHTPDDYQPPRPPPPTNRLPAWHQGRSLDHLSPIEGQAQALAGCKAWAQAWTDGQRTTGLLIVGPVGTGKTSLAAAIAVSTWTTGGWWNVRELASRAQAEFDASDAHHSVITSALSAPLLYLDDLGSDRETEWRRDLIRGLIERRYDRVAPLVVTSNLTDNELREHLGERAYSRLRATTTPIKVLGVDLRLRSS